MNDRPIEQVRADLAINPADGGRALLESPAAKDRLLADVPALLARGDEWRSIAEYALHLAMYGEHAPGGDETWAEFERRMRDRAERDGDRWRGK